MNAHKAGSAARGWTLALGAFLALHGLVHVFGFTATWHIGARTVVADKPSLVSVASGSGAAHALGLLWLVVGAAFVGSAIMVVRHRAAWLQWTAVAALLSLVLCVLWWRDAPAGAVIDALLLAVVALQLGRGVKHRGHAASPLVAIDSADVRRQPRADRVDVSHALS
ncbi:MAG: hypothetical protein M3R48_00905 [Candidatus Dormibacteraeota bacterium]|nr:hypothetical protein [Candidatus Dormibacteraeota bacterium]